MVSSSPVFGLLTPHRSSSSSHLNERNESVTPLLDEYSSLTQPPAFSTVLTPVCYRRRLMPTRIKSALLVLLLLVLCSFAGAEKIADIRPQGYVTDLAQVIDPATTSKLEALCAE